MSGRTRGGTKTGKAGSGGARALKCKVRTAKGRKLSSTRWLQRQLNDPYVAAAKKQGYRSRAAFKLLEMAEKYDFLKPGDLVVDLGAAPGGWAQVAAQRVAAVEGEGGKRGKVIALDITRINPIPGVELLQGDFLAVDAPERILAALSGHKANAVLSDMAPPATGHKKTDHLRIMALAEAALWFAREVLAPGGCFLAKVLQGGSERAMLEAMKRDFRTVRHVKPKASRAESAELYVLAIGFRGERGQETPVASDSA